MISFLQFDKEMCYKHVWLAGAILIFTFIMTAFTVNVQIDGVIDVGKKISYHYEVMIPDQKNKPLSNITQLRSSNRDQEQVQEPLKEQQSQIHDLTQKPTEEYKATPKQQDMKEQLRIQANSRKQATLDSYFINTTNKHVYSQQTQTTKYSEKQEQFRLKKPPIHEHLQINNSFRKHETLNPYFAPIYEEQQPQAQIQPELQLPTQESEQVQLQDRFHNEQQNRMQDKSDPYYNPVNYDHLADQQTEMKTFQNYDKSQLQQQQNYGRFQFDKNSHMQDKSNPYFNMEQIKNMSEKPGQLQGSQEQRQMQQFQNDKNVEIQDKTNTYSSYANGHLIGQEQQAIKKQAIQQEYPRELLQIQQFQIDKKLRVQDTLNPNDNLENTRSIEEQEKVEKDSNEKIQSEHHHNEKHLVKQVTSNSYYYAKNERQVNQKIKNQLMEQEQAQERQYSQLQEQSQLQERSQNYSNTEIQDTSNLYANSENKRLEDEQQQMKKQLALQEPKHLSIKEQRQIPERYQNYKNIWTQDTLNPYFSVRNDYLEGQQEQMQQKFDQQKQSHESKQSRGEQGHPQTQERFQIVKSLRTDNRSNAYFNPSDGSLLGRQLEIKKQSEERELSIKGQPHMQDVYEIDKSLRSQDVTNTYFNSLDARPFGTQQPIKKQSKEIVRSEDRKQSRLEEEPYIRELFSEDKNFRAQNITNQLNASQLLQKPYMKTRSAEELQSEEEQSEEYEVSGSQEQPQSQGSFEVEKHLRTSNKHFYSVNKRLTEEQPQMQEQSGKHSKSQDYEHPQVYEQLQMPGQPLMQEEFHIDNHPGKPNTPNLHFQSVNKELYEEPFGPGLQIPIDKQSRLQDILQLKEGLRTQNTPISYFVSENKGLSDTQYQSQERLVSHKQPKGYQQSQPKKESREQELISRQEEYLTNEPSQGHEQSRLLVQSEAYEKSRINLHSLMQAKSQIHKQSVMSSTINPYIISVNKRLEEEKLQKNEPTILQQTREQSPVMVKDTYRLEKLQNYEPLQTQEPLSSTVNSMNKLLGDKYSSMQTGSHVQDQSRELKQSNVEKISQMPPQYKSHVQIRGLKNQSRMQDMLQFHQAQIQGRLHTYDENMKSPYFYSVNKRILDEQSQLKDSSQAHVAMQTQETSNSFLHHVNKHIYNGQLQLKEQTRHPQKQKTHDTANKYFKSINKRLEEEKLQTQDPQHILKTTKLNFEPLNKRTTRKLMEENVKQIIHKEITTNRFIQSVNKRFTNDDTQALDHIRPGHKYVKVTTNRYFHSVNKRLTTEEIDHRLYVKNASDAEKTATKWFETTTISTTRSKKHRHHENNNQANSGHRGHHEHHDYYDHHVYHGHHYHHTHNTHHKPHDQSKVNSTTFVDLTIRKRKRQKTTTTTHGRSHHRNKTLLKMYSNFQREHTTLDSMHKGNTLNGFNLLQHKEKFTQSTFKKIQQDHTTKIISIGFQDLFTIKEHSLNQLRKETNATKEKRLINKLHQQAINKTLTLNIGTTIEPAYNKMVTQMITNLTFHEIFGQTQKIKNDMQIKTFTSHILQSGKNVFAVLKEKATDWAIKNKFDELAEIYETKYKEFLRDTCRHEIKTSLGKQKVILNAIDVSDRILKRLFNFVVADMDQRGNLRDNIATAINFQQEVEKETNLEFNHVCTNFGICRTGNGFPHFLVEYLTVLLKCNDAKFKLAMDSLTEVTKNIDFRDTFQQRTRHIILNTVNNLELLDVDTLRPAFMIVKNIVANKNKPLVVSRSESHSNRINSTLALLEIIDILDVKLPRTDANIIDWGDLRTSFEDWSQDRRSDIVQIMESFVKYIKAAVDNLHYDIKENIAQNFERVINVY